MECGWYEDPMDLYAFGSNGAGQLGIGHQDDIDTPQECSFVVKDNSLPVRLVASGNSTMILYESGQVYLAGAGFPPNAQSPSSTFHPLSLPKNSKAKLCSATWESSIIVTEADEVFVRGHGPKGELGIAFEVTLAKAHTKLNGFPPRDLSIVDIASSLSHTVVVLSSGDVYGWGNGRKGQLGLPSGIVRKPRKIEDVAFRVVRAVCGREFTLLLGEATSELLKIIGSDKWSVQTLAPTHLKDWRDIGTNWNGIAIQKSSGKIQAWGRDDRGQLAPNELPAVRQMAIGSEHGLAVTETGNVVCWGWGEHGNCGPLIHDDDHAPGAWIPMIKPNLIQCAQITGVGAGCATSFFWTKAKCNGL